MIITKMALPRRTVLRGMGTALALPFLDAMVPASSAMSKTAANPRMRLGVFQMGNGVGPDWLIRNGTETNFELSVVLSPLEPFKNQLIVVEGLSNSLADAKDNAGGPHARGAASMLNGVHIKRTEGADVYGAKSIDQYAADVLGKDTPLPSLELALETPVAGTCDQGYSCAYVNTFSWKTPTLPLPTENNPRVIFEQLFGDGSSVQAQMERMRKERSILDWMGDRITALEKQLGPGDRSTLREYVDSVRDIEQRIQKAEQASEANPLPEMGRPVGIPDSHEEHAKLMLDLQFLAYRADVTRVVSFQLTREQNGRTFPQIGCPEGHHIVSHHGGDPEKIRQYTKINTYFVDLFAGLVEKMRSTPDGDGSLLDHAILFYGAGLSDGDLHSVHNLPVALVGGGNGQLKGGRYLKYPLDTPMMNLGLSLLDKVGVELDSLTDSTGRLPGV